MNNKNAHFLHKAMRLLPYILLIAMVIVLLTNIRLVMTDGDSMQPTYQPGDILLCVRSYSPPEVGDVVLIRHNNKLVIKRVAHVAGDVVSNSYLENKIIPENHVYVLGDNPDNSHDSRYEDFGLVSVEKIWGKVAFCD